MSFLKLLGVILFWIWFIVAMFTWDWFYAGIGLSFALVLGAVEVELDAREIEP